jgi:hypothetical protein
MSCMKKILLIPGLLIITASQSVFGQAVPSEVENIPYLMTFGKEAETSWGDDDYSQTFFFVIPKEYTQPFFIRVFDPDCGGAIDELNGVFDTQTQFNIYGGTGCWSNDDAKQIHPTGNYKSGNMLANKAFGVNPRYDNNWYTFGPFNPTEGEKVSQFEDAHVFKMIAEGISGNDGNMYRYFLSTDANTNKPIEGANAFAYSYSFRMWDDPKQTSHVYPYVDDRTTAVKQTNFDWDFDGHIVMVSKMRVSQNFTVSGEDNVVSSEFKIEPKEQNSSLDIRLHKRPSPAIRNNNVVIYIQNQYGELLQFYASPIGGIPNPEKGIKTTKIPPVKK